MRPAALLAAFYVMAAVVWIVASTRIVVSATDTVGLIAAEELRDGCPDGDADAAGRVAASLETVRGFTANLLELSRGTVRERPSECDLAAMLRSTVDFARRHRHLAECEIHPELERGSIPFTGSA